MSADSSGVLDRVRESSGELGLLYSFILLKLADEIWLGLAFLTKSRSRGESKSKACSLRGIELIDYPCLRGASQHFSGASS